MLKIAIVVKSKQNNFWISRHSVKSYSRPFSAQLINQIQNNNSIIVPVLSFLHPQSSELIYVKEYIVFVLDDLKLMFGNGFISVMLKRLHKGKVRAHSFALICGITVSLSIKVTLYSFLITQLWNSYTLICLRITILKYKIIIATEK